ncbi:hypothetical protein BH23CHL5_BH23CHL5_07530 [soil metagenome]
MQNARTGDDSTTNRFSPMSPDGFLCRCEEVSFEQSIAAIAAGATTVDDLKRRTRAGMGLCQGAYCKAEMARLISICIGQPLSAITPMTFRPPRERSETLEALS